MSLLSSRTLCITMAHQLQGEVELGGDGEGEAADDEAGDDEDAGDTLVGGDFGEDGEAESGGGEQCADDDQRDHHVAGGVAGFRQGHRGSPAV